MAESWIFWWQKMMGGSTAHSDVCFIVCDGASKSHFQWLCNSKQCHLRCGSAPTDERWCPYSCACVLLSIPSKSTTHKLRGIQEFHVLLNEYWCNVPQCYSSIHKNHECGMFLLSPCCCEKASWALWISYTCLAFLKHTHPLINT
jgi:hypothetical protein